MKNGSRRDTTYHLFKKHMVRFKGLSFSHSLLDINSVNEILKNKKVQRLQFSYSVLFYVPKAVKR